MTRTARLAIIGALALALAVPATASAAYNPYRALVLKAACTNTKGLYGFGKVVLKLEAISFNEPEDGSGTNYFVFNSRRQEKIDGIWTTVEQSVVRSPVYPDRYGDLFSAVNKMKHDFTSVSHPRTRILMRVEFWDERPGADVRLARIGERTAAC